MKNLRSITTVLVCIAVLFSFFVSIIRVFGFRVYGVLSGSMEPAYPTGSLIYVRNVNPDDLRIGDAITFSLSPNVIATHRIVGIIPDENNPAFRRFQTKGDANRSVDTALVNPSNIIGKVAFSLPYLGKMADYIQKPPGIYVAILISAVLIFLVLLTDSKASKKLPFLNKKRTEQPVQAQLAGGYVTPPQQVQPLIPPQNGGGWQGVQGYPQQQVQPPVLPRPYAGQMQTVDPRYNTQQPFNAYPRQQMPPQQATHRYPQQQGHPLYRQPQGGYYPPQENGCRQAQQPVWHNGTQSVPCQQGNATVSQMPRYPVHSDAYQTDPQNGIQAPRRRRSGNQQV